MRDAPSPSGTDLNDEACPACAAVVLQHVLRTHGAGHSPLNTLLLAADMLVQQKVRPAGQAAAYRACAEVFTEAARALELRQAGDTMPPAMGRA